MSISAINNYSNYSALSQSSWIGMYGFPANKNTNLLEVEPVSAIEQPIYDIDNIDYDNVRKYEEKENSNNNSIIIDNKKVEENIKRTEKENSKNKIGDNSDEKKETKSSEDKKPNGELITEEDKAKIEQLKARDTEVKTHEQAHLSVAGDLAMSGASYTYQQGPDGKQYAVGGEVNIDTGAEDSPEKTIVKMQRVIAAAMAPADPSSQDQAVATSARKLISEMKSQIMQNDNSDATTKTQPTNKNNNYNKTENNTSDNSIKQELKPQNNNNTQNNISKNITNYTIHNQLDTYKRNNIFVSQYKGLYANFTA